MELEKIKAARAANRTVAYVSKANSGRGQVVKTYTSKKGDWVTVHDKALGRNVTVRPSQVTR